MATASPWQRPLESVRADVAIIGGGVIGTATAFWLRHLAPGLRVVILDAERLAHGASGRNAGFLLLGTHGDYASAVDAYGRDVARRTWQFTQENLSAITDELDATAIGLERTGSVLAAGSTDEAERLQRAQVLLAEDGVEAEWVGGSDVQRRIGAGGYHGALVVPEGGEMDPARLVRHLADRSGAEVREGWRVSDIEPGTDAVRLSGLGGGTVEAGRAVVCVNALLPQLLPDLAHLVRPVRAQMLATAPVAPVLSAPVYSHDGYYYLRQRADGRVLLGGARHLHEADEVGYEDATTDALQASLGDYLAAHLPLAARAPVERRWSGTMGFSPDGLPIVGDVPEVPGALFAAGFTGHGMGYGVRFGLLIARRLVGQADPATDLFSLDRLKSVATPLAVDSRAPMRVHPPDSHRHP